MISMPIKVSLNRRNSLLCSTTANNYSNYSIVNTHLFNESAEEGRYNKAALQALPQSMRVNTQNNGERK
jgi:hypothetical protein